MNLQAVLEALLFASQGPLTVKEMRRILADAAEEGGDESARALAKAPEKEISAALRRIEEEVEAAGRGYVLEEVAGGYQFASRAEFGPWVRQLFGQTRPTRLSAPAMETLAIIAYRQPISRAEIEAVRGVAVDGVVATLQERGLIKVTGRAEAPGRPLIYQTTQLFLEHFGLKDLSELPNSEELRRVPLPKPAEAPAEGELNLRNEPETPQTGDRPVGPEAAEAAEPAA